LQAVNVPANITAVSANARLFFNFILFSPPLSRLLGLTIILLAMSNYNIVVLTEQFNFGHCASKYSYW